MEAQVVPIFVAEDICDALLKEAFPVQRPVKSSAYVLGARAVLMNRLVGKPIEMPYRPGTAAADAWDAGKIEGKVIARQASLQKQAANHLTTASRPWHPAKIERAGQ